MEMKALLDLFMRGIASPEGLWKERLQEQHAWTTLFKTPILPLIVGTTLMSAILTLLFGYKVPFIGVIQPSIIDVIWQMAGSVLLYTLSLIIFGYIAAYLASLMEGKQNMDRAVEMLFLVSIPSLLGQILGTLPYVGLFLALGFGIYSLLLLYRAIPLFLEVPLVHRTRHLLLFFTAAIVVSILMNMTLGALFSPKMTKEDAVQAITPPLQTKHREDKDPESYVTDFFESMSLGDHGAKVVTAAHDDTFVPPADKRLTKEQVERFIQLATRIETVRKEQNRALSEKYDERQEDEFSFSDIFSGIKDITNLATLDMKVVKTNGGNWAEFQWVKEQLREAYFTPSLNATTEHNAKLLEPYKERIRSFL